MKRNALLLLLPLLLASCANNEVSSSTSLKEQPSDSSSQITNSSSSTTSSTTVKKGYYDDINTELTGEYLRDALHYLISQRTNTAYDDLWDTYALADVDENGRINDIYSKTTDYTSDSHGSAFSYGSEGGGFNREHVIPKSWWSGHKKDQQGGDPFIVMPSDGYINRMRDNYPFGEVNGTPTFKSDGGYCKMGTGKYGYNDTVFEPSDDFKGNLARVYFYAATCYDAQHWTETREAESTFTNQTGHIGLTDYATKLFLKWHLQDPVDDTERHRNDIIYTITSNRNPFIDHPEWATTIWGTETF